MTSTDPSDGNDRALAQAAAKAEFARRLKSAIEGKNWSLREAADQVARFLAPGAKFGPAHVWHYLQGRTLPRPRYLQALSRALGVEPGDLISEALLREAKRTTAKRARTSPAPAPKNAPPPCGRAAGATSEGHDPDIRPQRVETVVRVLERPTERTAPDPLVLILTSDRAAQVAAEGRLRAFGYDVALASTSEDARHHLEHCRVSILVADLESEMVDRLALVQSARQLDPVLPVIYTAQDPARLTRCEKVAGAPCLRSPYHPDRLLTLIRPLLRRTLDDQDHDAA